MTGIGPALLAGPDAIYQQGRITMTKKIMEKKINKKVILAALVFLIIFLLFQGDKTEKIEPFKFIPGQWDISRQVEGQNLEQFLIEEEDFDYTNENVYKIAQQIKSSSSSPYDAVKSTARYVYDNIKYNSKITVSYCYEETASSTLKVGSSDCVGMTRLNVALLRAMGIPARSVGGCLKSSERCSPLFAVAPGIEAKVTPLEEGDFKKRGFLHEWVEVYTPETGWLNLEATSGQIFPISCGQYLKFGEGYDTNKFDRCTISNQNFINLCGIS